MDVRELVGEDFIARFHKTRVIPEKFRSSKPDGIYDLEDRGCKTREIIIDGCVMIRISKMWLDKGGPVDLPEEIRYPWGTYLK